MQFLLENTLLVGVVGTVLSGLVGFTGLKLNEFRVVYGAVALLLVTAALVVASIWIETDREQIQRTMHEVAQAVKENDHRKVVSYFHPAASTGVEHAKSELPRYTFQKARVTSLRNLTVNELTDPPTAITEFLAAFRVSSDSSNLYGAEVDGRRFVKVYWTKHEGRWLVRDYEHHDFMEGFKNRD